MRGLTKSPILLLLQIADDDDAGAAVRSISHGVPAAAAAASISCPSDWSAASCTACASAACATSAASRIRIATTAGAARVILLIREWRGRRGEVRGVTRDALGDAKVIDVAIHVIGEIERTRPDIKRHGRECRRSPGRCV